MHIDFINLSPEIDNVVGVCGRSSEYKQFPMPRQAEFLLNSFVFSILIQIIHRENKQVPGMMDARRIDSGHARRDLNIVLEKRLAQQGPQQIGINDILDGQHWCVWCSHVYKFGNMSANKVGHKGARLAYMLTSNMRNN